jgi:hypothetical protein
VVAMLVRVLCILCSFVWSPGHGLLGGSLIEGKGHYLIKGC